MLNILKPVLAFIIALVALLLFYYFISIPILPCISLYIAGGLFIQDPDRPCYSISLILRTITVFLIAAAGFLLYTTNLFVTVRTAETLNFFFIITEGLTAISFVTAYISINALAKGNR